MHKSIDRGRFQDRFFDGPGGRGADFNALDTGGLHPSSDTLAPRRGAADENRSKNGSGTDLGPLIIDFVAFWSDAKKSCFVDAFLEAQKIRKIGRGASEWLQVGPGTSAENGFFGIWVPGAARARLGTRN